MRKIDYKISVIVPVFNEEGCINEITERLQKILERYKNYEILFIDDGSTDGSLSLIKKQKSGDERVQYISFSRNFGHQNALRAGINHASGDCIISLDADLQHPPELIIEMVGKWIEGYDVVYTIRKEEKNKSFIKKISSGIFYNLMNFISDIKFRHGEADFRLLDRSTADELNNMTEDSLFLRGMVKWLGFNQIGIEYVPEKRMWGKTKYSRKKMFNLAISGITGFSIRPLRISTLIGLTIAFLSLIYGIYALYQKIFTSNTVEGWTSVFFMVTFIGGIQLIMIGILGEYIGKIFKESKKRPHYIIKENSLNIN